MSRVLIGMGLCLAGYLAGRGGGEPLPGGSAAAPDAEIGGAAAAEQPAAGAVPEEFVSLSKDFSGRSAQASGVWPGKGKGIRFVTYNLKNYLTMAREGGAGTSEAVAKPEREIAVVVDTLARLEPDILGVCEMGGMAEVEDLRGRLRERGVVLDAVEWVDAADEDRHLALFSRFPIVERNSQAKLTYLLGEREHAVGRGFLDATVEAPGGYRLRCVGVHLKSKREVPDGDQEWMRRNEADLLRKHVNGIQQRQPEVNLLVYGDFNDTVNEGAIRAIQGAFGSPGYLTALPVQDDRGETWTHHWAAADTYSRIDFIFYGRGLGPEIERQHSFVCAREDWETASDHRAVVAAIWPGERRR